MRIISLRRLSGAAPHLLFQRRAPREFHISRKARDAYHFDESLFTSTGCAVFPDFNAVRRFSALLNASSGVPARAGEINAMGLIDEIFHYVILLYKEQRNPHLFDKLHAWLNDKIGEETVDRVLTAFTACFPPREVYRERQTPEQYLSRTTEGTPNRHLLLEEMILLMIAGLNPAYDLYRRELFDDSRLSAFPGYPQVVEQIRVFFSYQPPFGPENADLVSMLRSPAHAEPHSIPSQLDYIRRTWGLMLEDFLSRLLSGLDLIREEEKFGTPGVGETLVYDFSNAAYYDEYEKFSPDREWMPRLILLAKSSHVWLDQLSKKYQSSITRLDHIPDAELDELASMGFTGLWLIGLWERSRASERIKRICGNPEAIASAYSVFEYRIAGELGGEEALDNLKQRAWRRGIRLASDMVPNHMGIDSPWLAEHPDRFLYLPYCPYPAYTFNGPDLSADPRISIYLEDHYYDRTDAAVVFKWVRRENGEVRYIYHGNDGTAMPWNDTAQLNYLNPETREAVINTIFSVAGRFPVIRFDAAMTLSKRHYQRLWYPEPGSGGDIPTRAGNGLSKEEFNRKMPQEFWREVVDRFSGAHTDNLLLAEAFWLMEAYFVRTLGMHRVYNSAFMNFLKNEDNAQFRTSIKNVLTFNPQILKRFVNFMNNPDEETAVAQFGKDDKYFGVCTLMVTLPGLPMFGHGQIEGYAEKYGMEYRRAYWDETPDPWLKERHNREIFPLMRKRYLFSDVENFLFYDFYSEHHGVNEHVICYSNRFREERVVVIYNNRFATASGWLNVSAPFAAREGEAETQRRRTLSDGLGLNGGDGWFSIFRDQVSGLEYIRNNGELGRRGLYVRLDAFKRALFWEFREVEDVGGDYGRLAEMLNGAGVQSIEEMLRKYFRNPLAKPFSELLAPHMLHRLLSSTAEATDEALREYESLLTDFYRAVASLHEPNAAPSPEKAAKLSRMRLEKLLTAYSQPAALFPGQTPGTEAFSAFVSHMLDTHFLLIPTLTFGIVLWGAVEASPEGRTTADMWQMAEYWRLTEIFAERLARMEASPEQSQRALKRIRIKAFFHDLPIQAMTPDRETAALLRRFFDDRDVRELTGFNRHDNVSWIHKESFNDLLDCFFMASLLESPPDITSPETFAIYIQKQRHAVEALKQRAERNKYRVDDFVENTVPGDDPESHSPR